MRVQVEGSLEQLDVVSARLKGGLSHPKVLALFRLSDSCIVGPHLINGHGDDFRHDAETWIRIWVKETAVLPCKGRSGFHIESRDLGVIVNHDIERVEGHLHPYVEGFLLWLLHLVAYVCEAVPHYVGFRAVTSIAGRAVVPACKIVASCIALAVGKLVLEAGFRELFGTYCTDGSIGRARRERSVSAVCTVGSKRTEAVHAARPTIIASSILG